MRYCACIGNFDGVHLGHQKLIRETVECARQYNLIPAAITFDPDPMQYFSDYKDKILTDSEQKKELLYKYGIEEVLLFPFDDVIANMADSDFVHFVLNEMEIHTLLCGEDFSYGKNGKGNPDKLKNDPDKNFTVRIVSDLKIDDEKISSTRIRQLISNGEIEKAVSLLGHDYTITSSNNVLPPAGRYLTSEWKEYKFNPSAKIRTLNLLKEL